MSNQLNHAQTLENKGNFAAAIQLYEDVIRNSENETESLAYANFRLGHIYREWGELFAAQRFLSQAYQLNPENTDIRHAIDSLNQHFSQNRDLIADQMSRQNSDQIVSLFFFSSCIKLIAMDKPVQAYPLMKSRTRIFPNAAVAKHLLTDIRITDEERNSAIEFLIEKEWLDNADADLYTITESGLYGFYTALAQLHIDNSAHSDAITCYDQAYWLDDSQLTPLYHKVNCHVALEAWDKAVAAITELPTEIPSEIEPIPYYAAIAQSFHHTYQKTGSDSDKQKVIEACEAVLHLDKRNKAISKLLASYQDKTRWWHR